MSLPEQSSGVLNQILRIKKENDRQGKAAFGAVPGAGK
jgi:hypothetical protein